MISVLSLERAWVLSRPFSLGDINGGHQGGTLYSPTQLSCLKADSQ